MHASSQSPFRPPTARPSWDVGAVRTPDPARDRERAVRRRPSPAWASAVAAGRLAD
jgi:hypothetical protein